MLHWEAVAFWGFMAVVVAMSIWRQVTLRRETEKTIRMAIEKGQTLDPAIIEQLLRSSERMSGGSGGTSGYPAGATVLIAIGFGLPLMGYFIKLGGDAGALFPLIGVGAFILLIAVALLVVWAFSRRSARASSKAPVA